MQNPDSFRKNICMLMAFGIGLFSFGVASGKEYPMGIDQVKANFFGNDLEGGWEYTASGAPVGYDKGFIIIVGERGKYQVSVQAGAGVYEGRNVTVKKNTIQFVINIDGENVSVSLTASGSTMSGTSSSSQGSYAIKGVKSLSQG
ncbi:MAG: hypothetical protein AAGA86_04625 [Bacteroidota bacterium]